MFNRMKIYTVHINPDDTGSRFTPVFIKEGFNMMAFVFTVFWALYQRLWVVALALVAINLGLVVLAKAHLLTHLSVAAVHLGMHILVGYHANDWLRARMGKKGYIISDVTAADSFLRAEQRYLERYVAAVG